ncbi:MAG: hypothetical protein FWE13_02740 [Firmicutes bacterium]|nr:hypothetical protein [Bacillota bacterium]
MRRIFRKVIILGTAVVMLFSIFTFVGCSQPRKVYGDVFIYYILNRNEIALVGVQPSAKPDDGIFRIPAEVNGRRVVSFAHMTSGAWGTFGTFFSIPFFARKTIVEAGIPLSARAIGSFRGIIEFECPNAENMTFPETRRLFIVPDGSIENYRAAIRRQPELAERLFGAHAIQERSSMQDWYVDGSGILLGYFGMETEHLVLPNHIREIRGFSFNGVREPGPTTLILNEGLERIGYRSLWFTGGLSEIRIPQSVHYIELSMNFEGTGTAGITAGRIYIYRNTEINYSLFVSFFMERVIFYD